MLSVRSCSPRGDEALDALDVPGAVGLRDRPGAAGADVGAGVGLGEHHRRRPSRLSTKSLAHFFCSLGALDVQRVREGRAGRVHPDRRRWSRGPARRATTTGPAARACRPSAAGRSRRQNSDVHERVVRLLERCGQRRGVRRRVEDRRVAVAVGVAGGEVLAGQPVDLGEHVARGVRVEIGVRPLAERRVGAEDLEEVELEVAQVALVVGHRCWPPALVAGVTRQ